MQLITLSAADPLNLQGILTPGPRIAAFTTNRVLFCNGLPVGALEAARFAGFPTIPFRIRKWKPPFESGSCGRRCGLTTNDIVARFWGAHASRIRELFRAILISPIAEV